jgi:type II secretion system protein N
MKKPGLQIKNRIAKVLLIGLYCIVLGAAIFYFRFPYTQTVKWIAALGNKNPDIFVSHNSLERKFPNRVEISGMTVFQVKNDTYKEIVRMPKAVFRMNPLMALFNKVSVTMQGRMYSGLTSIDIDGHLWGKNKRNYNLKFQFQDIQLAQHPEVNRPGNLVSQLGISGFGEFQLKRKFSDATGNFEITSTDGQIDLSRFIAFWKTPVPYSKILVRGNLQKKIIYLTDILLESEEITGSAAGELSIVESNPRYSTIELNGELTPIGEQMKNISVFLTGGQDTTTIPFRVTGTLRRPNFSMQSQGILSQ